MSDYHRANTKGATCFFIVLTYRRQKFLTLPENRHAMRIPSIQRYGGGQCPPCNA